MLSNDSLSFVVVRNHDRSFIVCAQIDVTSITVSKEEYAWIYIIIQDYGAEFYTVEKADFQETRYSTHRDWSRDFSLTHTIRARYLGMRKSKRLSGASNEVGF